MIGVISNGTVWYRWRNGWRTSLSYLAKQPSWLTFQDSPRWLYLQQLRNQGTTMYPLWQTTAPPQLIARALQLEALSEILNSVRSGHGRCVVVTGEAGIGKSRLVHELSAGAAGFWLLQGTCSEDSDGLAYGPLQDLLRRHLSGLPPDKHWMHSARGQVS